MGLCPAWLSDVLWRLGDDDGMKRWMVIAIASVIAAGAVALAGYRMYLNEVRDNAVKLVPPNALAYMNVFLNPSTHQKQALRDLLAKFPGAGDPEDAVNTLGKYLDDALAGTGVDYSHDIKPWLGREVAVALLPPLPIDEPDAVPSVLVYAGTEDPGASMEMVDAVNDHSDADTESKSYDGVDYEMNEEDHLVAGVIDDFLVLAGDESSFRKAVVASNGRSLADEADYADAVAPLTEDRIALFYASLPGFVSALEDAPAPPGALTLPIPEPLHHLTPAAVGAYLRPDGVVIETAFRSGNVADGGEDVLREVPDGSDVLGMVPQGAWAAIGVHDLGASLRQGLALALGQGVFGGFSRVALAAQLKTSTGLDLEEDVLTWMGNAAGFVEGTKIPRGGAVVASNDSARSADTVYRLGQALASQGVPAGTGDHDATHATVAFTDSTLPGLLQLIAVPERVWLVFGEKTADEIDGPTLARSPTFRQAAAGLSGFSLVGYADAQKARTFFERTYVKANGSLPVAYSEKVAPNLEPLSFVGLGGRTQDGVTSYRLMIGVK